MRSLETERYFQSCFIHLLTIFHFFQNAKDHGATGLLIEYEDMFPFEGMLKDVAAVNHYNKSDIYNILIKSKELGLEVIPLVQTFGHMEFILKHGQFAHLRDSAEMPESICPCHQQTMSLIGMIKPYSINSFLY